jgi:hypothetical protein
MKGVSKMEWISVKERLPEKEGKYLTNNGQRYFKKDWIYNFDLIDKDVTHWINIRK